MAAISLVQIPRMVDKTVFGKTSSHYITFFTFVMYVFIRASEYWYLLLKGSIWYFAVELAFGVLQYSES